MTLSEFALLLFPICKDEEVRYKGEFMSVFISRIMVEGTEDSCPVLSSDPNYMRSILRGAEPFPKESANAMLTHINKGRFEEYLQEKLEAISLEKQLELGDALGLRDDHSVAGICAHCSDLYESLLKDIVNDVTVSSKSVSTRDSFDLATDAIKELRDRIEEVKPEAVEPPSEIQPEEQKYIRALFSAYGSAENIPDFSAQHLAQYNNYAEDLTDRRIDYFAAETIRRGVQELFNGRFSDQFDVLKDEIYNGVKNTVRRSFPNGYDRMLVVMERALDVPVEQYLLNNTKYWIGNSIKCGVCHHLVNDDRLRWVR